MTEIKPCPFCNSAGMWIRSKSSFGMACKVQCIDEDCGVERGCWYSDDERGRAKAAEVWNTRAAPDIAGLVEAATALADWPLSGPEPSRLWDDLRQALAKFRSE
jgi:Restriction alleviation protein Lar